ncbi:MAG: cysteine desulfurase family protein [Alphaproteobacteria bacterium]
MKPRSYLDYNATVPVKPAVTEAVAAALERVGNPSSVHSFGRLARRAVEDARGRVAALVGAQPRQVVFTSGGTEANNLALEGSGRARRLVSAVEHVSVLEAAAEAIQLPVDDDGVVDLEALARELARDETPALVSVMLANNETGVIEPVAEVAALAHADGALVHCDAVQAAGKVPVNMAALGIDLLTLSAHKLGGPQGAGALVVGDDVPLAPMLLGGGQEIGRRAGTENAPALVGFGVAAELAAVDVADGARLTHLRDRLERRLSAVAPGTRVFAAGVRRLPNTSCFTMPGVKSETQVMALDLAGVAVSAGAACSSGKVAPSHVLGAMGVPSAEAETAIRVSLGWQTSADDIDRLIEAWSALYARAGERRAGRPRSGDAALPAA